MIINHNLSALNTQNSLAKNENATNKSIKNLSTGFRINGAADDAAGLAISEKMRGQISGLKQASANAQDGISMLQTAEGALDQTHSILQRMRELAVQSASDTNTADDRTKIQSEVDQLAKEISRISNTTEFNTQNLLAGGLSSTFHIGANANQNITVSVGAMDASSLGVASALTAATGVAVGTTALSLESVGRGFSAATGYKVSVTQVNASIDSAVTTVKQKDANNAETLVLSNSDKFTGTIDTDYQVKVASVDNTATTSTVKSVSYSKDGGASWITVSGDFDTGVTIDGMKIELDNATVANNSGKYTVGDKYSFSVYTSYETLQLTGTVDGVANQNIGSSVDVHKGDTGVTVGNGATGEAVNLEFDYDKLSAGTMSFNVKEIDSSAAVVVNGNVTTNAYVAAGIDVSGQASANEAITTIDKAINSVSQQRSQLGAYQNRLTNTIDNLNTSNENITASEARIRDVDMASEMSTYQKNNILQQAATAMLAKANQQPQSVLQLLQG
ncbi:MAG: flagellin [Firmicutes bacterium]|nr:flagellin [Bacillota bacterium]